MNKYRSDMVRRQPRTRFADPAEAAGTLSFAVEPDMVHPDCEQINVIVGVPDDFEPDIVVIGDEEAMIEGAD
jgi:hypothetical protein